MNIDPQSLLIWHKFNYNFVESTHTYYYNNVDPVKYSVTQYISRFFPEFNQHEISLKYAQKHNMTQEEVLSEWKFKADVSAISGTMIHSWLENAKRGKTLDIYQPSMDSKVSEAVRNRLDILMPKAEAFHRDTIGKLYPIQLEYTVGIKDIIAGNIDMLCWNEYAKEFQIWDYKNTKEISRSGFKNARCLAPFNDYQDCNYVHYSIQLNVYKAILQRELNIDIGNMYLVHFDYTKKDNSFNIYECADYQNIIKCELEKLILENS